MFVYCVKELGLDIEKVNVNGGAIALGHPLDKLHFTLETDVVADGRVALYTLYRCQANCHRTSRTCSEKRKGKSSPISAGLRSPVGGAHVGLEGTDWENPTDFGHVNVYRHRDGSSWRFRPGLTGVDRQGENRQQTPQHSEPPLVFRSRSIYPRSVLCTSILLPSSTSNCVFAGNQGEVAPLAWNIKIAWPGLRIAEVSEAACRGGSGAESGST